MEGTVHQMICICLTLLSFVGCVQHITFEDFPDKPKDVSNFQIVLPRTVEQMHHVLNIRIAFSSFFTCLTKFSLGMEQKSWSSFLVKLKITLNDSVSIGFI